MMNPATAPSYMQGYPGNPSMQMQAMGQPNMMDSSVAMSQGGNPGGVVVTSFNGGSSTSNPSHMSVQQTPNATVIPTGMSNGHMMTSGPPGSLPMHMTRQVPPNGAMYPAGHPANMAMMKGHAVNPNAKYAAGPMMPAGMNGNPHNAAMMMGNGPMSAQQIAMYSNNNTVPYSPHGMYQQQFPMGAMGGASQQRGMPKQMMGNQMMMSQEMAAAAAAQQNRVMNSMNGGPPNGMNRVGGQPQNGMNPNMYPPGQVHMNPQQQQQSMQTQHMFQGMVPNSSHSMSTQQQQSLSMQQSASMAAAAAAQNGVSTANMNANMLNRQQQQQKLIALQQQQQQHFQQQQQQQRVSQQMAMRQAITPPANLGSDTSQGMMMNPNYPQGPMPMGPNGRLTMKDQQNSSMGGPNSINGPMPSPASAQQQMTASMTMIGAPHSVPASHEVMPVSPQVQPNQLGMHGQNMGSMNPLMTSASKRQTATPPSASPISNQHPMNNPAQHPNNNSSSSRATPSPIHQRKHSSSASLKRRSSSTSSFNNDCNNPNDPNKPSSNNATDDISGEPSKICRLSSSTNIDATNPMSFNCTTNNATSIRNPMSTGGPSSTSYSTLTLSQLNDNSRKDSTCSSSNTDTHSSPDSGMGDSVGESSNVCGMNNTSNNNNNNSQNPLSRLMPSNNNNNNSIRTSTEEMLENLIQELGIEKLDHLPELVDIFSDCNDSVFSSNTTSSNTTNPNQTTASHGYSTTNNSASSTSATDTKMKQSLLSCSAQRTTNPIGQKC